MSSRKCISCTCRKFKTCSHSSTSTFYIYRKTSTNRPFRQKILLNRKAHPRAVHSSVCCLFRISRTTSEVTLRINSDIIDFENMGTKLFMFLKLMKVLENLMPFNSNLCFTYNFNPEICKYDDFLNYIRS